jgi:hypothetical protein
MMLGYTTAKFFTGKSTTHKQQIGENSAVVYLNIMPCQIKVLTCITLCQTKNYEKKNKKNICENIFDCIAES